MITRSELLRRALAQWGLEPGRDAHDDEHALAGLFGDFRDQPDLLRDFLEGVPDADEICRRFRVLADAVGDARQPDRADASDAYFIVREPSTSSLLDVRALLEAHAASMAAACDEAGEPAVARVLREPFELVIDERASKSPRFEICADLDVREIALDHLRPRLYRSEHPILALRQAAYSIAASDPIACFLLWPALRDTVSLDDPFASYVALWARGIDWSRRESRVVLHAPRLSP